MITIAKIIGFLLLILVGYHYINNPLGFSIAGSIATVIFAICLMSIYQSYIPDGKNLIGWGLIAFGCLILATFSSFSLWLFLPGFLIVAGYRLAELPFSMSSIGGDSGLSGDSGGGCDFGGDGGGD